MQLKDEEAYNDWKKKNDSPYGKYCFTWAEKYMELLEKGMENGLLPSNWFELSFEADTEGGTGMQAGFVAAIITKCWRHGDLFRKAWNYRYDKDYDGDGVVNPAIINIEL